MTEIVFLRHGRALGTLEAGVKSDSERPLSPLGEKEARETAEHLKTAGFRAELIISSPYRRADSTAQILRVFFPEASSRKSSVIADGPADDMLEAVRSAAASAKSGVIIVGHQPLLGSIAAFLTGSAPFSLAPAGFIRISGSVNPGKSSLVEFYSPPAAKGPSL